MAAARRHEMEARIRPGEGRGKIGDKEISEMSNSFVRRSSLSLRKSLFILLRVLSYMTSKLKGGIGVDQGKVDKVWKVV